MLDRIGPGLSSCGDTALVLCSESLALGFGNFPALRLKHLIPRKRLQEDYLVRLMQEITTSALVLRYLRSGAVSPNPNRVNTIARYFFSLIRQGWRQARIYKASQDGVYLGVKIVRDLELTASKTPMRSYESEARVGMRS